MRQPPPLKFRQIHLDFHTSEHIDGIGERFSEEQFIDALTKGHVNSVTAFALCHHGWAYYDTKVGKPHPNLKTNLLPRMLAAAKEAGIDMPVYLTVGWNELMGREHPEWVVRTKEGVMDSLVHDPTKPRRGWHRICLNTPYLDFLLHMTKEVMERFNPVGIFYDICWEKPCYCETCKKTMEDRGWSVDDDAKAWELAREVYRNYLKKTSDLIRSINPAARVYHNGADKKGRPDIIPYFSHYEIESLPTTDWGGGYPHFPQNAKYFMKKGLDFLGMTGKFHESWGEFGGFKSVAALRYECARIIMHGGKCSIGDQLHPHGVMEEETYRRIGEAYSEVEAKEAWCTDVNPVADVGVLCPSAQGKDDGAEVGASMMLTEAHVLFDMIDEDEDFEQYKLLILPDSVTVTPPLEEKLAMYVKSGRKVIMSGNAGLDETKSAFKIDAGVAYVGDSPWYIDFTLVSEAIAANMVRSPYFNHTPGVKTRVTDGEVLAQAYAPFFNRTFDVFCSHGNTPYSGEDAGYPAVVQKGGVIYIAHNIFTTYHEKGMKLHRDLVINCVNRLLPEQTLRTSLPSGGMATLFEKNDKKSYVLHLLYATPIKLGGIEVIEDTPTLHHIDVRLRVPKKALDVRLQPDQKALPFTQSGDTCVFTLSSLTLHQMVEIRFA